MMCNLLNHSIIVVAIVSAVVMTPSCRRDVVEASLEETIPASEDTLTFTYCDDIFYTGPYRIYHEFGSLKPGYEEGLPEIPGAVYRSNLHFHILFKCPNDQGLREWTSNRMKLFTDRCLSDSIPSNVKPCPNPSSSNAILQYYTAQLGGVNMKPEIPSEPFEQFGIALFDIYNAGGYITMEEYNWYDYWSCGCNNATSWFTVEKQTGRELQMYDIIKRNRYNDFKMLVIKHLRNGGYRWCESGNLNEERIENAMNEMSGIALVKEGVVVYFLPYTIGSGGEGQFNSLIPYDELQGIMFAGLKL